jgi:hypothetical protein
MVKCFLLQFPSYTFQITNSKFHMPCELNNTGKICHHAVTYSCPVFLTGFSGYDGGDKNWMNKCCMETSLKGHTRMREVNN